MSSDCGFGRQGCNREIAFYKASALAQGANIVRKELGLATTYVAAADPALQIDIVPTSSAPQRLCEKGNCSQAFRRPIVPGSRRA